MLKGKDSTTGIKYLPILRTGNRLHRNTCYKQYYKQANKCNKKHWKRYQAVIRLFCSSLKWNNKVLCIKKVIKYLLWCIISIRTQDTRRVQEYSFWGASHKMTNLSSWMVTYSYCMGYNFCSSVGSRSRTWHTIYEWERSKNNLVNITWNGTSAATKPSILW